MNIIHRDIKCANILVGVDGTLKLCDFGLARFVVRTEKPLALTPRVVTRWYRAPELLLDDKFYSYGVDVWSCGCVLAEILSEGKPIFSGKDEDDTLRLICGMIQTEMLEK
jgi:serine/threonine protein kinase